MTSLSNLMCILQCLCRIRKKPLHLFRRFYIILTSVVTHSIFIRQFLSRLKTQQYIMRLCILCQRIMDIICCDQLNTCLTMHFEKLLVHILLLRYPMILQFQEKVSLSKNILISQCGSFGILIHSPGEITCHFACKACT